MQGMAFGLSRGSPTFIRMQRLTDRLVRAGNHTEQRITDLSGGGHLALNLKEISEQKSEAMINSGGHPESCRRKKM